MLITAATDVAYTRLARTVGRVLRQPGLKAVPGTFYDCHKGRLRVVVREDGAWAHVWAMDAHVRRAAVHADPHLRPMVVEYDQHTGTLEIVDCDARWWRGEHVDVLTTATRDP